MKKYKDLDLRKIRIDNDLDFAHFTYQKGQCSCCYGPLDLPARYWRNGKKPELVCEVESGEEGYSAATHYKIDGKIIDLNNVKYILFNNADNGSGIVKRDDEISFGTCISWNLTQDQLDGVCKDLQEQLGSEYKVVKPETKLHCIVIERGDC